MHQITLQTSGRVDSKLWVADVPSITRPKVNKTTVEINGEHFYKSPDGRLFIPELFDKMFNPSSGIKMNLKARRDTAGRVVDSVKRPAKKAPWPHSENGRVKAKGK